MSSNFYCFIGKLTVVLNPDVNYYANKLEEKSTEELLNSLFDLLSVPFVCVCYNFDITLFLLSFWEFHHNKLRKISMHWSIKMRQVPHYNRLLLFLMASNKRLVSSFRLFHSLKLFLLKYIPFGVVSSCEYLSLFQ